MLIVPDVNLLRSMRAERIDHLAMICEGVDNAFDADAHSISITFDPNEEIVFQDDGSGILPDNIEKLFSLGAHGEMPTTRLGRFGIGLKAHAARAGDVLEVDTVSRQGRVRASADWQRILNSQKWEIDDPRIMPFVVGTPTGSTIWIYDLQDAPAVKFDNLIEELAKRFYPAIAEGRRIVLNDFTVPRLIDPPMADIIEHDIGLSDGRGAKVRAGILTQPSKLHHVHIGYEHRVIMPGSTVGCTGYSGLHKMFARVQLTGRAWHLARFKDDLPDETERTELEAAVQEILRPILEKCTTAAMHGRVDQMMQLLNDMLPPEFAGARPNRLQPKQQSGHKQSKKSGNVSPEKSEPQGPAKAKRPPHDLIQIDFDGIDEEDGVGDFKPGRPNRVSLSRDNYLIAKLVEHRDTEVGALALYAIAMAIYEHGRPIQSRQGELPFASFGKRIAHLLALQRPQDIARI
jgi:hypothetical protein